MAFTKKSTTSNKYAKMRPSPPAKENTEIPEEQEFTETEFQETESLPEAEEPETEQESEEEAYQDQNSPAPKRRAQPQRSFGNHSSRGSNRGEHGQGGFAGNSGRGDTPRKALRLTGLFAGKREGLFSGRMRAEDASNLAELIAEAEQSGQLVSFFLWENQGNPVFSLTANITDPSRAGFGGNRGRGHGNYGGGNRGRIGYRRGGQYT